MRFTTTTQRRFPMPAVVPILATFIGCLVTVQTPVRCEETIPKVNPVQQISNANADFGFRLFAEMQKAQPNGNVFFSPYSVSSALTMTLNGANSDTLVQMGRTLSLKKIPLENVNRGYEALNMRLKTPGEGVRMNVANSLWANQNLTFIDSFLNDNQKSFNAEVANLNFGNSRAAADRINGWVNKQTQGKIDNLVKPDSLSNMTAMVLVNAIYFQGDWSYPFEKAATKDEPFQLVGRQTVSVPMMRRAKMEKYGYMKGEGFQAVRLPYGSPKPRESRFSLYVFLPDRQDGLRDLLNTLSAENWDSWRRQMRPTEGTVILPKFKMQYESELNKALTALGMGIAFDREKADFSGMLRQKAFISKVNHKAVLEVDEKGSTAAAATSVEMGLLSVMPARKPFTMKVDHPFFLAIVEESTGQILFMGAVWNPTG